MSERHDSLRPWLRLGVTGTDTGVGKTRVTCALLEALGRRGLSASGMKPIETGIDERSRGTDAELIHAAAGGRDDPSDVGPITLRAPLAPMVASRLEGREVSLERIEAAFARLSAGRDAVVVEGAGGLLVPISASESFAELFARLELEVVLVAANRLGVINHVRLSAREIERSGLVLRAVVLNETIGGEPDLARQTNGEALRELLGSVPLVVFPYVSGDGVSSRQRLEQAAETLCDALDARAGRG